MGCRNETLDQTHLCEFFQVEGVIAGEGITLGDLIGFLDVFFRKMGITNLRYKPAFNPYTEPSLEIFSYHKGLKKWVVSEHFPWFQNIGSDSRCQEIGNSGMFRPEMLLPMGVPENVRVLGFG